MRLLYPSFAGSWATAWIAKEAGYFSAEGLDVELIRVGGSSRMVAAMLGGSAPIIQAGAIAALTANDRRQRRRDHRLHRHGVAVSSDRASRKSNSRRT